MTSAQCIVPVTPNRQCVTNTNASIYIFIQTKLTNFDHPNKNVEHPK